MIKKTLLTALIIFCSLCIEAQTPLSECYEMAYKNYPLIRQYGLIEQSKDFDLKNARTAIYPQFALNLKATYQSEVTTVPISGVSSIPKDQYQIIAEVDQSIWDGGVTKATKQSIETSSEIDMKSIDVEIYTLRERVDNLFFGVLMLDEQLAVNSIMDSELKRNLKAVESYVAGGVANSADVDAVKVEILSNNQNRVAIEATRVAYLEMLSAMTGVEITLLERPSFPSVVTGEINSPELRLFDAQLLNLESQKNLINSGVRPKIGAFLQCAYGNPGLNMLKAGFTPYAIGGLKFTWNFSGFYTRRNDLSKIETARSQISVQRDKFLYNNSLSVTQTEGEVEKLRRQIEDDNEIIVLRGNIKRASEARVAGGTMSVTDMLTELTKENNAIQAKVLHEVELLMNMYIIKTKVNQ